MLLRVDLAFLSVGSIFKNLTLPLGLLHQAVFSDDMVRIMKIWYPIVVTLKYKEKWYATVHIC